MGYKHRLNRAFEDAPVLPVNENTRYILMSDCHRGTGSCVHPYGIMGIELNGYRACLVKWRLAVQEDGRLYVERVVV